MRLEEERVDNYLHTSTKPKLLKQVRVKKGGWRGGGVCWAMLFGGSLFAAGPALAVVALSKSTSVGWY